jgi:glycosyltransferase involved in cell wall biosynthesis
MRSMAGDLRPRPASLLATPATILFGAAACLREARRLQPDVIHAHWLLPNGLIGALVSRLTGIPLAVSLPGSDLLVARLNALTRLMARFTLGQARLITANSQELRDVALGLGADPDRFDLIVYGVDSEQLRADPDAGQALRERMGLQPDAFVVLAVGRMVPKKGFRYLIQALPALRERVPDAHVVMVGDGDERANLERMASALEVRAAVDFVGSVPKDEIVAYYSAADVLTMPSVTEPEDGLNVCVLDAMSCALPIVATTVAGNPLVVREGTNGYLVPERRADLLAEALARLAADREGARRMGLAGRHRVETEFSWPYLAGRYLEHFRRISSLPSA